MLYLNRCWFELCLSCAKSLHINLGLKLNLITSLTLQQGPKEVPEDGIIKLPTLTKAEKVKVILVTPKDDPEGNTPDKYNVTVSVHACFHFKGKARKILNLLLRLKP